MKAVCACVPVSPQVRVSSLPIYTKAHCISSPVFSLSAPAPVCVPQTLHMGRALQQPLVQLVLLSLLAAFGS